MKSKNEKDDIDLSIFVLCTNDIHRTYQELINLYRLRWRIETAFGSLKSNFDVRKPIIMKRL